jgi:hypothetical protein
MDDRYQPRRPDDRDEPQRRRPDDDDDYPRRPPRPQARQMSVLGLIGLICGVLGLIIAFIPCVGLFTLPLPIIGVILAIIGIIVSAAGKREGFGLPVTALALNMVACVVPFIMFFGMCGLMTKGVQQAAQQAIADAQAEKERQDREAAEAESVNATTVVGLAAGPGGSVLCLAPLADDLSAGRDETVPRVGLTQLVNSNLAYVAKVVRVQGTVESSGKNDDGDPFLNLSEKKISISRIHCVFDDFDPDDAAKLPKKGLVTVEGTCEGRLGGPGGIVWLSNCRVVK